MVERQACAAGRAAALAVVILAVPASHAETPFDGPLPMAACAGWDGERVCEVLHEDDYIRVARCAFPPGTGHEPHYHPPHVGYRLEGGVMRVTSPDGVLETTGEGPPQFVNEGEVVHEVVNIGDETARYLIIEKKYADRRAAEDIAPGLCARE